MAKSGMGNKKQKQKYFFKKKKKKLILTFDEDARRDFLTGFHKRKVERRNKAKEELEMQLKAERKRIKAEAKEAYKKLVVTNRPIPELEELLSEEIDMGTHSVRVTELSTDEMARQNNWIGLNHVQYDNDSEEKEVTRRIQIKTEIEGMDIRRKHADSEATAKTNESSAKSSKDIKKAIKRQATQTVKNSKVFQAKNKIEKLKNIKVKRKLERKKEKNIKDKRAKHKKRR